MKKSDQYRRFLLHGHYQEYKMNGHTETHFPSLVVRVSPSKPSHSLTCTPSLHTTLPQKISSAYLVCAQVRIYPAGLDRELLSSSQSFFWVLLKSNYQLPHLTSESNFNHGITLLQLVQLAGMRLTPASPSLKCSSWYKVLHCV